MSPVAPRRHVAPAPLLVLASITSLQIGAAVAKGLFPQVGALGVVVLRIGVAALVLLVVWRPRLHGRGAGELARLLMFGLVLGGMNLAFFQALTLVPLGVAVTLELLGPLTVAVALARARRDLIWVTLALVSVVLLTSGGGRVAPAGVALALAAAVLRGTYVLLSRWAGRESSDGGGLALALAAGALVLVPVGALRVGAGLLDARVLLLGLVVGLLSSALPYTLDLAALRRLTAPAFGVLVSLSPAVAAVVGVVLLDEQLLPRQWVAVALVVVASAGITSGTARQGPPVSG